MHIVSEIKKILRKYNWKQNNKDNHTYLIGDTKGERIYVGKGTYGGINAFCYDDTHSLRIGNYCSIAEEVVFLLSSEHKTNNISTFPYKVKFMGVQEEAGSKGDIIVEDDVWIGYGTLIMSGVHIGQGAVIAAGSVVTKDIPAYAVAGGTPAKIIKYRFSPEMIKELLKVDYGKLTETMVKEHINELYTELKDIGQLDWMPKRK